MIKKLPTLWTCEFSETQQCFNCDTLEASLDRNQAMFDSHLSNDWSILSLHPTLKEASATANFLRSERGIPTVIERFINDLPK
jgi:hypothetical protein